MFLVNLTWLQFAAVFGGISLGVIALYLWDRSKRRIRVPTLRFWTASEKVADTKRRRRIQQPVSLLLQLLSAALLLLALSELRLGSPGPASRDHVLILDTSAWMAAHTASGTLMDEAQTAARFFVRSLPAGDRVMLVRADALTTPATAFERIPAAVEQAITAARPGSTALNLGQAIEFARQAQRLQGGVPGEIVYAGAGRVSDRSTDLDRVARHIRVLPVRDSLENCGLRRIGLRRSAADPEVWEVLAAVRNFGSQPKNVSVALTLNGAPAGVRPLLLSPGAETDVTFQCRSRSAGRMEARLSPGDSYPGDDQAAVDVPAQKPLNVTVYSSEPDDLRPVLSNNPLVNTVYRQPSEYRPGPAGNIVILDRFNPPSRPTGNAIWIEPPEAGAPVALRATLKNVPVAMWRTEHPIGAGLRAKDLHLDSAEVFAPAATDAVVAEVEQGPVIVARDGPPRSVVLGFHPARGALRYELTTPLLFANILRWMAPDIFRRWELNAGSAGAVSVPVDARVDPASVRVTAEHGLELPYTVEDGEVRFFAPSPGTVRVTAGDREIVYSLILPQIPETRWAPPAGVPVGIPKPAPARTAFVELWPWLAAAGALVFLLEWALFGRYPFGRAGSYASPASARLKAEAAP